MTELDVTPGGDAFMSTFTPRLDDKGRLFLPAKWRETLGERVVLTKGADRCVTGYSAAGFNAHVSARLRRAPTSSRAVRDLRRALMGAAEPNKPDGQGRIRTASLSARGTISRSGRRGPTTTSNARATTPSTALTGMRGWRFSLNETVVLGLQPYSRRDFPRAGLADGDQVPSTRHPQPRTERTQ